MSDAVKGALDKAAQSWCCGDAACHYNDCGLPCEARDHARMGQAIAAFLRALSGCDLRTPEDGEMTMDELAAAVEGAARSREGKDG
jgi:hypothetical protein